MELVALVCIATGAGFVQGDLYSCQPAARRTGLGASCWVLGCPAPLLHSSAPQPPCPTSAPAQTLAVTEPGAVQSWQWLVATSWPSAALPDVSCEAVHKEQSLASHQRDSKGS